MILWNFFTDDALHVFNIINQQSVYNFAYYM